MCNLQSYDDDRSLLKYKHHADPDSGLVPVIHFYYVHNLYRRKKYAAGMVGDGFEEGVGGMEGSG